MKESFRQRIGNVLSSPIKTVVEEGESTVIDDILTERTERRLKVENLSTINLIIIGVMPRGSNKSIYQRLNTPILCYATCLIGQYGDVLPFWNADEFWLS